MTCLHNLVMTFALSALTALGGIGCIAPASAADDTTDLALDDESSILGDEATKEASQELDLGCGEPAYAPPLDQPYLPPPPYGAPVPVPVPVAAPVPVAVPVPVPGCVIPLPVLVPTPFAIPIAIPSPVLVPVPLPIPTYVVTPVPFPVPFLAPYPVPVAYPIAVPAPCNPGLYGFGC